MRSESKILDYPVFALSYADGYLVASGGGGGLNYGINNKLEVFKLRSKFRSEEFHLQSETTEQDGIIDSLDYNQKVKIWIGSLDDSTIIFSYKPSFGMKIFGTFKTDFTNKDPKQNVCKFGHESNYFVTGGNDCCVRVWRLSDKLIKNVKDFHQVKKINNNSESHNKAKHRRKSTKIPPVNGEGGSASLSEDEDDISNIEEMLVDKSKLLHNDVLLTRVESSTDGQSSIDDTSPSPTSIASPIISSSDNALKLGGNLLGSDQEPNDAARESDLPLVNGKKQSRKNRKGEQLCTKVLDYRYHLKPINDCYIFNELLVSLSNDCMIFYKLLPVSKLLLKHREDNSYFKFVKILVKDPKSVSHQDSNNQLYTLLTLEYSSSFTVSKKKKPGNVESLDFVSNGKDGTQVTMWNFNIMTKKLTRLKSVHISNHKSSAIALDSSENHFAVGFGDGSVSVYSVQNFKLVKRFKNHKLPVTDLAFVSKEKLLSSGIDYYVFVNEIKKFNFKYYWLLISTFLLIVSIVAGRYGNVV